MTSPDPTVPLPKVPLATLFAGMLRVALSSFGGSTSAMVHREVVDRRGWLSEAQYLATLTVAQVLPGANPVNIAVYVGLQLRGAAGAAVAGAAMVLPAFALILVLGAVYARIGSDPLAQTVLGGLAAVGLAAMLAMGLRTARALKGDAPLVLLAAATFLAFGVFRLPLIPVVCVAAPVAVLLAWRAR